MTDKTPRGLGRGLDALFDRADTQPAAPGNLALEAMVPGPWQPRTRMDDEGLQELAHSIREQGIMQPILVRRRPGGAAGPEDAASWEIIAGERRWRAARLAGLARVPVLVRDVSDRAAAAMALIENIQRENLNPLEEARGLERLVQEFGLTHEQAAQAVGRSRSAASNLLRLLKLAAPVQALLLDGLLDMGHARALLPLDNARQITAAQRIASEKLSARAAERLVAGLLAPARPEAARPAHTSRDVQRLEEELSDLLMAEVQILLRGKRGEQGQVRIHFGSPDALEGIIERLRANTMQT